MVFGAKDGTECAWLYRPRNPFAAGSRSLFYPAGAAAECKNRNKQKTGSSNTVLVCRISVYPTAQAYSCASPPPIC